MSISTSSWLLADALMLTPRLTCLNLCIRALAAQTAHAPFGEQVAHASFGEQLAHAPFGEQVAHAPFGDHLTSI